METGVQKFFPTDGPAFAIQSAFGIHIAGMSRHQPPFEISRLDFDQHSAYFCLEGKGEYVTGAGRGVVRPGEVWLVPARYPHHYWVETEWRYVWVHFRDDAQWAVWHTLGERRLRCHRIDQLRRVAEGIIEQGERWDEVDVMEEWVRLLVAYLRRELTAPDEPSQRWAGILADVWREVRRDPSRPWRASQLAAMAHVSLPHFNRIMRLVYGASPSVVLGKIRAETALTLLRGTDMTLDAIAGRVGYSSGFAMSRAFRRLFGESPRRYADKR